MADGQGTLDVRPIAGARPNFMKIAPMVRAIERTPNARYRLIHTGQHYDRDMSDVFFFEELGIPRPGISLEAGGGSYAEQTAKIMVRFERECIQGKPDSLVVIGDVNSTLACSIVAKKLGVPVAHIEAGQRSGDMAIPNRTSHVNTDSDFALPDRCLANLRRSSLAEP